MRKFILTNATDVLLGKESTSPVTGINNVKLDAGKLGFIGYQTDTTTGKYPVIISTSTIPERMQIILGNGSDKAPYVIPFYNHNFSYEKMVYAAATTFVGTITCAAPTYVGDYTVIVVKKGVPFNMRAKFSSEIYIKDTNTTAVQLASKIATAINSNSIASGVTAAVGTTVGTNDHIVTITASEAGVDYEIVLADNLRENGTTLSYTTRGIPAKADENMIAELYNKAIADMGINDTYQEPSSLLRKTYPFEKAERTPNTYGYTLYTIKFSVPREVKTRDEVVNQILQIAVPNTSNASGAVVDGLDALLAAI